VLLASGVMTAVSPARDALLAQRRLGILQIARMGDVQMKLLVAPGQVGDNEFGVDILDRRPGAEQVAGQVLLRFTSIDMNMGTIQVETVSQDGLRYVARGSYLSMAGAWQVEVILRKPRFDDVRKTFILQTQSPSDESARDPDQQEYQYNVERVQFTGRPEVVIQNGIWPRLSPDGKRLAYLSMERTGTENHLYVSDLNGADPVRINQPADSPSVDAHIFLPGGDTILFSAVNPQPKPSGSWLDRLLGITLASAHNVPSDWYQVTLPGGGPQRLTRLNDTGMFADISPAGDRIIFISAIGLYTMKLDGSDLVQISPQLFVGTVDWIE
jgi:hypothetical protein